MGRSTVRSSAVVSLDHLTTAPEAALRRAVESSRRRAMETIGAVAVLKDGRVVWEKADGTSVNEPEQVARND